MKGRIRIEERLLRCPWAVPARVTPLAPLTKGPGPEQYTSVSLSTDGQCQSPGQVVSSTSHSDTTKKRKQPGVNTSAAPPIQSAASNSRPQGPAGDGAYETSKAKDVGMAFAEPRRCAASVAEPTLNRIFQHMREFRIIRCKTCAYAVVPEQMDGHLKDHHKEISASIRRQIVRGCNEYGRSGASKRRCSVPTCPPPPPFKDSPSMMTGFGVNGKMRGRINVSMSAARAGVFKSTAEISTNG
jgi:hypothetical protein